MFHKENLSFFQNIMKNMNLKTHLLTKDSHDTEDLDLGIRKLFNLTHDYQKFVRYFFEDIDENTIYSLSDAFYCHYIFLSVPDCNEKTIFVIGPYTEIPHDRKLLLSSAEKHSIPPHLFSQIENYYSHLPFFADAGTLFILINTLGETLWNGIDNYTIKNITHSLSQEISFLPKETPEDNEDRTLGMEIVERRYNIEKRLMQAVSKGLSHKAELIVGNFSNQAFEERVADPIRNMKNYTIILNTLLRKAVENGGVHPFHIDKLSSDFAVKIELVHSDKEVFRLQKDMIHKYCLLVKNHSMKGYSLLVRKILTAIDTDLTADLSLKSMAAMLNVNASYLSSLFKKETGCTLTEYCNRKRVEHALFLLNSTSMQVQDIALHCGIPDVNYFTKLFKKIIGKTPREYRDSVL